MLMSFQYALEGIVWAVKHHRNLQIYIAVAFLVLILSFVLHVSRTDGFLLMFITLLCIMAEMLNTALEEITDLITIKWSHQAKIVKDVGAGMSLVASITALVTGIVIFTPYLLGNL